MTLTETEQARYDAFIAAVRGSDPYSIALALHRQTPGIDWRGCTRTRMAEAYAEATHPLGDKSMTKVDLGRLRRMLLAKKAGEYHWLSVK